MKKTLQLKRAMRAALLVLLLSVAGMGKGYAWDFSAVCDSGQRLYFEIVSTTGYIPKVKVTFPNTSFNPVYYNWDYDPWDQYPKPTGNLSIPSSITVYYGEEWSEYYQVVEIDECTFKGCTGLTSVSIPSSVGIGMGAFYGCSSLQTVILPYSLTYISKAMFSGCSSLQSITLPSSLTSIGEDAFYRCSSLQSITLPNTLTSIGKCAFSGCSGLHSITLPNRLTSIGEHAFSSCSGLSTLIFKADKCESVGEDWLKGTPITNVTVEEGVQVIPRNFLRDCATVTSLAFPNSATTIGAYAFSGSGLTSITIPNSVHAIGFCALDCPYLDTLSFNGTRFEQYPGYDWSNWFGNPDIIYNDSTTNTFNLIIGNAVTSVPHQLFHNGYEHISVDPNNQRYDSRDNCDAIIESSSNNLFMGCKSTIIPNTVVSIGEEAFRECVGLSSITIPNSVTSIKDRSFYRCKSLSSISIPDSVTFIGNQVFYGCSGLREVYFNATNCGEGSFSNLNITSMIIGENVKTIPRNFVSDCKSLTAVTIPGSVTTIGENAFSGCDGLASVIIPQTVESINKSFTNCSRLTTVYWNAENASGSSVFSNCPNLTTLHIGSDVKEIGTNIFKGCTGVHLVVAMGPTPATLVGNAFGDLADNSILMVSCNKRLTYFSVWNMFDFDHIMEDCGEYNISTNIVGSGGNITLSQENAQMGEEVQLTVTPNPGMHLASLTVCNANDPTQIIPVNLVGKATSTYSFTMPPFGVVVMASFATGTSVDEVSNIIPITVYPNPTSGKVRIEAEGMRSVGVFNLIGQQIFHGQADGDEFEIDLSGYDAGVYLIRIETGNGAATKRVVLTR